MSWPHVERRKQTRYDYPSNIEFRKSKTTEPLQKGVANNISNEGMGLYVFQPFREGQDIIITSALPIDARTAVIRWIKKVHDDFYRAGLTFRADPAAAPRDAVEAQRPGPSV